MIGDSEGGCLKQRRRLASQLKQLTCKSGMSAPLLQGLILTPRFKATEPRDKSVSATAPAHTLRSTLRRTGRHLTCHPTPAAGCGGCWGAAATCTASAAAMFRRFWWETQLVYAKASLPCKAPRTA